MGELTVHWFAAVSHWVFAYGSNMNLRDLRAFAERSGESAAGILRASRARLVGFELCWNYYSEARRGGAANVRRVEAPAGLAAAEVRGLALRVDALMLGVLDRKEGHPHRYVRQPRTVELDDGDPIQSWVYEVRPAYRRAEFVPPRRDYLQLVVEAAEAHALPEAYVEWLRRTPTAD